MAFDSVGNGYDLALYSSPHLTHFSLHFYRAGKSAYFLSDSVTFYAHLKALENLRVGENSRIFAGLHVHKVLWSRFTASSKLGDGLCYYTRFCEVIATVVRFGIRIYVLLGGQKEAVILGSCPDRDLDRSPVVVRYRFQDTSSCGETHQTSREVVGQTVVNGKTTYTKKPRV